MSDAWRWMPISRRPSKASMPREMSYRISTRSQLLPATPRLQRHIFINRYRRTTKATVTSWIVAPPETTLRGLNLQKPALRGVSVQLDRLLPQPPLNNRGHMR